MKGKYEFNLTDSSNFYFDADYLHTLYPLPTYDHADLWLNACYIILNLVSGVEVLQFKSGKSYEHEEFEKQNFFDHASQIIIDSFDYIEFEIVKCDFELARSLLKWEK